MCLRRCDKSKIDKFPSKETLDEDKIINKVRLSTPDYIPPVDWLKERRELRLKGSVSALSKPTKVVQ